MVHEIIEHCMGGLGSPDGVCGTIDAFELSLRALKYIVLCKSIFSEGKELISNWPIKNEKP